MARDMVTTAAMGRMFMVDMHRPITADTHHTMVMGTVIGGRIARPMLTMVDPLITAVGTEVGVTAGKAANKKTQSKNLGLLFWFAPLITLLLREPSSFSFLNAVVRSGVVALAMMFSCGPTNGHHRL
jgi:hypothetical protein